LFCHRGSAMKTMCANPYPMKFWCLKFIEHDRVD